MATYTPTKEELVVLEDWNGQKKRGYRTSTRPARKRTWGENHAHDHSVDVCKRFGVIMQIYGQLTTFLEKHLH